MISYSQIRYDTPTFCIAINICEILLYNRQLFVIAYVITYTLFGLLAARGNIVVKEDY